MNNKTWLLTTTAVSIIILLAVLLLLSLSVLYLSIWHSVSTQRCLYLPKNGRLALEDYAMLVRDISRRMAALDQSAGSGRIKVTMARTARSSTNLFRPRLSSSQEVGLDLTRLNGMIGEVPLVVQKAGQEEEGGDMPCLYVDVAGSTRFDNLVDFLLPLGLVPAVVPELISITVGGAISGVGIESSSWRHGLLHDTVLEIDVLLANGRVVTARSGSPLLAAIPNSYGTLGYLLRARLLLQPAAQYVVVQTRMFSDSRSFFQTLQQQAVDGNKSLSHSSSSAVRFMEGLVLAPNRLVLLLGREAQAADSTVPIVDPRDRALWRVVNDCASSTSPARLTSFKMTMRDYLFRWDADGFFSTPACLQTGPLRRLMRPLLSTDGLRALSKYLPQSKAARVRESLVQDVGVPMAHCVGFLAWLDTALGGMYPVWICPYRDPPNRWSLWRSIGTAIEGYGHLACDFGIGFGLPGPLLERLPADEREGHEYPYLRRLESKLLEIGGTKGLYSRNSYDYTTFVTQVIDGQTYVTLKAALDPRQRFYTLWDKAVGSR